MQDMFFAYRILLNFGQVLLFFNALSFSLVNTARRETGVSSGRAIFGGASNKEGASEARIQHEHDCNENAAPGSMLVILYARRVVCWQVNG